MRVTTLLRRLTLMSFLGVMASGCPQLLDDDFHTVSAGGDASLGGSGGSPDGSLGGSAGSGGSGGVSGGDGGDASPCASCGAGESCCDDVCVSTLNDPKNCGACGVGCPGTTCVSGQCSGVCALGFLDCDQNAVNGCEANAATDPDNCGSCGAKCSFDQSCVLGKCTCPTGSGNCDGLVTNGCETDLANDAKNCGDCGTTCGANQACIAGKCSCAAGFEDCNKDAADGCEATLATSPLNCGSCGTSCGVKGLCTAGKCGCQAGFLDCDTSPGCETAKTDPNNCGTCGHVCSGTTGVCNGTSCVSSCSAGETLCGSSCVDTQTDPLDCGGCNKPVGLNQICTNGQPACQTGFADCDGQPGCEVDLTSDENHCGSCATACKPGAVCSSSSCGCAATTPNDCGTACRACCASTDCTDSDPCTTDICSAGGTCSHSSCATGTVCCALGCFACCLDSDCTGGKVCSNNQCVVPTCNAPQILCDGKCVDPASDAKNCGGCGIDCGIGRACAAGKCAPSWVPSGTSGALGARSRAAYASLSGTGRAFVWGGANPSGTPLDDGAIYDLATDAWTPVPTTASTPSARVLASAVWTGDRVFVWGGGDASNADLGDGALFDPATSIWTTISATNAPKARRAAYLTWTGTRVLVWGGVDGAGNAVGGAGLYDPATGAWSTVSTTAALPTRLDPTVGWNGTDFFIYGGHVATSQTNQLGSYRPSADTWASLANGPSQRFGALGTWDGSYLVAWGGRKEGGGPPATYADGRRYDPTVDGWINLATTGVPSARYGSHRQTGWSARIAAGSVLILGGLSPSSAPLTDGGIYASTTNTWTAVPAWPSAESHLYGVAVWLDSEFLLWGGQNASTTTATGERFRP